MYHKSLIALDVETTTISNGDPYNPDNKLVSISIYDGKTHYWFYKNFNLEEIQHFINNNKIIVSNGKFEEGWLHRIGINLTDAEVIDIQLAEFILSNQTHIMPSLNGMALKYLNRQKIDNIKLNYWDKGIDTWFIPEPELREYNEEDTKLTYEIWTHQEQLLVQQNKLNLFHTDCLDQLVLHEMEYNGILYDVEQSLKQAEKVDDESNVCKQELISLSGLNCFDPASNDHLSALLYGGKIVEDERIPIGVYKSGAKVGHIRYKVLKKEHILPRLIEPLKGTEYKKGNIWSTDEDTLLSLKPKGHVKHICDLILKRRGLEKLNSTYLRGFPKIIKERNWENNIIHSTLNQCVAKTGRLSSAKPNSQNMDENTKSNCVSRYD